VQLIFSEQCTQAADGQCYHVDHYVCSDCRNPLAGHQYVILNGRPFCTKCFHSTYADNCGACGQIIAVEQRHVVHTNRKWHDSCFRCDSCGRSLVGRACLLVADSRIFCSDGHGCDHRRQSQLLPVDNSWSSNSANDDEYKEMYTRKQALVDSPHQLQLMNHQHSADAVRLLSRQTTV